MHRKLAHALARGGLMDVIKELASMPFQQFKAKVAELVRATQANSLRRKVPKQELTLKPIKDSGRESCKTIQPST